MINKELIELQKGCEATCAVIQNEDCKELDSKIIVNINTSDSELIKIFKENNLSKEEVKYFVIYEIDQLDKNLQDKYYQIVKDREFNGYKLSNDVIIILTVKDRENLKNISQKLYNLCVIAF